MARTSVQKSNLAVTQHEVEARLTPQAQAAQRRILTTLSAELLLMDKAELKELAAMTDAEVLAYIALKAVERVPYTIAQQARMRLKGSERFAALLEEHGGVYTTQQAAEVLGSTPEAVKKAAQRRRLLAFKQQGQWLFPVWQFNDQGTILAGLADLLKALPEGLAERDAVRFFLSQTEDGKAVTPLDLLQQGDQRALAIAKRKAQRFMVHVAA